ncbi:MAG: hypothetical protein ABIA67_06860 [Candidatus Margulisiibacteriota bacterium]
MAEAIGSRLPQTRAAILQKCKKAALNFSSPIRWTRKKEILATA